MPEGAVGQTEGTPAQDSAGTATETPAVELDGEKVTVEQIKEWRAGHLRQDDYTRKTQEVAEQKRTMDNFNQWLANRPDEVMKTIEEKYADRLKELRGDLKQAEAGGENAEAAELKKEIAGLKGKLGQMEQYHYQEAQQKQGQEVEQWISRAMDSDKIAKGMSDGSKGLVRRAAINNLWALSTRQQITPQDITKIVADSSKEVRGILDRDREDYIKAKTADAGAPVAGSGAGASATGKPAGDIPASMDDPAFMERLDAFTRTRDKGV